MKKIITTLLMIAVLVCLTPAEKAEAFVPVIMYYMAAQTAPVWMPYVYTAGVFIVSGLGMNEWEKHKAKDEALEYMCEHRNEWRERHPEWDIYEKDFNERCGEQKYEADLNKEFDSQGHLEGGETMGTNGKLIVSNDAGG